MRIKVCWARENNPDILSGLIMWHNKLGISHVLLKYEDRDGREVIAHATAKGVNLESPTEFMKDHTLPRQEDILLNCTPEEFYCYIDGQLGKKYGYGQFLFILFGLKAFRNGKSKMICSELVGRVLHKFTNIKLKGNPDKWTPADLWRRI